MNYLRQNVPIFQWLPEYSSQKLPKDLAAGITVGIMLIPQGMAYAMLAGMPPIYGLYASTVPLVLYAIFGTSRQLAVGPVAMDSLLIATGVSLLAEMGTDHYIELAILLAFMVGGIQFILGLLRLGFLVNFLSHPVMTGFTSAAAIVIGLSQLKHLLGLDIPRSNLPHQILANAISAWDQIHLPTLILGVGAIILMLYIHKIHRLIPRPLAAVVLSILAVYFFRLDLTGIKVVGEIPGGLPELKLVTLETESITRLIPIALTISLVAFMEAIAVAKSIQAKHKDYEVDPNQELKALGFANLGGSFFQSFPVTGGFSRSAVNDQAGAQTGMASIISALLIVVTLLFLTPLFYFLPQSVLASVIMVAVFKLIDFKEVVYLWRTDKRDLGLLVITFFGTMTLGIQQGIAVGVVLSLAMVVYRSTRPHIAVLGRIPGSHQFRNVERFPEVEVPEGVLIIRFDSQLFFANTSYLRDQLRDLVKSRPDQIRLIIINANAINGMDSSAVHALDQIIDEFREKDIDLYFTSVIGPVRDILHRSGLLTKIGEENFFMNTDQAVQAYQESKATSGDPRAVQYFG